MIRINLLPIRQTQKRQTVQQQLLGGAAVIIVTLIICIIWYAKISGDQKQLQQSVQKKTQELAQLDLIIGKVNDLEAKKKELQEKQKIIEDLRKGKTGPVRALDDLATEIPDRVWITKLEEKGGSVKIEGTAINHENVSAFMKSLQKSKYFSGVSLGFSKASTNDKNGVTLYEFQITCRVNYSA